MTSLSAYLRERFPVPATTVLALATALLLTAGAGIGSPGSRVQSDRYGVTAIVGLELFAFMLRSRVVDEFKDSIHDQANYPDRPLPSGLITRRQLIALGIVAVTVELASVVWLGISSAGWSALDIYAGIAAYGLLMGKEFFAGPFLIRHFNLYLALHQLIWLGFAAWVIAVVGSWSVPNILGGAGFALLMFGAEVARKYEVRLDPRGRAVSDTYITVWGRLAASLTMALTLAVGTACVTLGNGLSVSLLDSLQLALATLVGIALILLRNLDRQVQALFFVAFIVLAGLGWPW